MRRVLCVPHGFSAAVATVTARRGVGLSATLGLGDDSLAFQQAAAAYTKTHLEPNAATWDREKTFPIEALREAAKLGFGAIYTSPEHGGSGLSRLDASLIFEQLSMSCASTAAFLSIHNMATWMVDLFGTAETRAELVPSLATMDKVACYCLTEATSGSDAAALRTVAVDKGDHYEVTGAKSFISGAGAGDVYVTMVRTGASGAKGVSCLAIDKALPGVSFGKLEDKLGWNSQPTRIVRFDSVRVPKARRLGSEGEGFKIAMKGLDGGRVNIATCSLGAAQRCLDLSTAYTKDRRQFGTPVAEFQNTQFRLAEMAGKVHTSRLLIREAARAIDRDDPEKTALCAVAKFTATEQCYEVVDQALQLHGGYGYLNDYPVERHLRDLRVHRILEGTNEVMRVIVARTLLSG